MERMSRTVCFFCSWKSLQFDESDLSDHSFQSGPTSLLRHWNTQLYSPASNRKNTLVYSCMFRDVFGDHCTAVLHGYDCVPTKNTVSGSGRLLDLRPTWIRPGSLLPVHSACTVEFFCLWIVLSCLPHPHPPTAQGPIRPGLILQGNLSFSQQPQTWRLAKSTPPWWSWNTTVRARPKSCRRCVRNR